jgi:hypothetical protein
MAKQGKFKVGVFPTDGGGCLLLKIFLLELLQGVV